MISRLYHLMGRALLCTACCLFAMVGCESAVPVTTQNSEASLRTLGLLYGQYIAQQGRPPASREDFEKFLVAGGTEDPAKRMVSPRDGKPLVLLCGNRVGPVGPGGLPWMAYEKTGVNGKRLLISARGAVEEFDADQFKEIFPNED